MVICWRLGFIALTGGQICHSGMEKGGKCRQERRKSAGVSAKMAGVFSVKLTVGLRKAEKSGKGVTQSGFRIQDSEAETTLTAKVAKDAKDRRCSWGNKRSRRN